MRKVWEKIVAFLNDENGPTAVEYAVMLALIVIACLTAIGRLGNQVGDILTRITGSLEAQGG